MTRWPWLESAAFLSPLVAHMLAPQIVGFFFDSSAPGGEQAVMIATVAVQIVTAAFLWAIFFPVWLSHFRFRISWLAIAVGAVGFVLWVAICNLKLESGLLSLVGLQNLLPARGAFNPFDEISNPALRNFFLAMRFTTLALVVPVAEELMLRGWLVRWIEDTAWTDVTFSKLGWTALLAPTACSILTHPEIFAAIVWFSLVTWLMVHTKNLWDCIAAHMITNLLLGVYVVLTGNWLLW